MADLMPDICHSRRNLPAITAMKHRARGIILSFRSRIACRLCNDIPAGIIIRQRIQWRRVINFEL